MVQRSAKTAAPFFPWRNGDGLRTRLCFCCAVFLLVSAGCGRQTDRQALQGTVTLDGAPLAEGYVTFVPMPGTSGPTAGGKITEGKFSVSPRQGTFVGAFRVEITAIRKTGRKLKDPMLGQEIDETEQFLPARYNRQSELTIEVTKAGPNHFEFDLTSQ